MEFDWFGGSGIRLVSLLTHAIRIFPGSFAGAQPRADQHDRVLVLPPSKVGAARVQVEREPAGAIQVQGATKLIDLFNTIDGDITGLPHPVDGVVYVVSRMVFEHPQAQERLDLARPGPNVTVNNIAVGCAGLVVRPGFMGGR